MLIPELPPPGAQEAGAGAERGAAAPPVAPGAGGAGASAEAASAATAASESGAAAAGGAASGWVLRRDRPLVVCSGSGAGLDPASLRELRELSDTPPVQQNWVFDCVSGGGAGVGPRDQAPTCACG